MRVCVVGAGAAGLCSARHLLAEPLVSRVDILEQSSGLGGTWVYTENVGYDDFGLPIHTSMYKSLRTNLPKEVMGFPDFPIKGSEKSYISAKEMLNFLDRYAEEHNVKKCIKFKHHVQMIKPKQTPAGELWDVTYKHLATGLSTTREYDYVFVCNGHYNTPFIPNIPGLKNFEGEVMHSHDYRVPDVFKDKNVLVIGAGPSGLDIALEITSVCSKVILSHHIKDQLKSTFPSNLEQKPDVVRIEGNAAVFQDGTTEQIDVVFLCTGYLYNFPFLHESCDIVVEDNCVEPLYKHVVNIRHPSMCFIGVPYYVCAFSMFDLQVRYFVQSMNGSFQLPSSEQMMQHWEMEKSERLARGYTKRQAHMMGPDQQRYYSSLATEARTKDLPSVITKMRDESSIRFLHKLQTYRMDVYKIIDDDTYEVISGGKREVYS
ncbi:senecionine N-oxygenase-like isoform X2 [Danaus plexippus]|uniref:senecionine N-oxygenase-like isoform X2 n=1 Tax=Danaus plexippus TaxID=13037 RepID=UPI0013C4301E|nr:senecionine N-oxygenase-like isoform X2 [Danaus plexippus]